jgi:hypothetical protein
MIDVIWRNIGRIWSGNGRSVMINAPLVAIGPAEWWRFEFYGAMRNASSSKRIRVVLGADETTGNPGITLAEYGPANADLPYQVIAVVANQGGGVYFAATQLNLGGTVPGITNCFIIPEADIAQNRIELIADANEGDVVNGIFIARKEWQSTEE